MTFRDFHGSSESEYDMAPARPRAPRRPRRLPFLLRTTIQTLAPWSLGAALLVSFTASAGETFRVIDREFRRSVMIESQRLTLLPPRLSVLSVKPPGEAPTDPPGGTGDAPEVRNAWRVLPHIRKVDLGREIQREAATGAPLLFVTDRAVLPATALEPAVTLTRASQALLARLNRFDGRTLAPGMRGDLRSEGRSPQEIARVLARSRPDGTTPGVTSATRLASTTPNLSQPEIIAAAAMRIPAFARVHGDPDGRPVETARLKVGTGYLDVVDPESLKRESQCLAEAVYFESRSEPEDGQAAVAQVVLNRVRSGLYPTTICGVVYQNRHRYKACQFSFACEGRSLAIKEPGPWSVAQRIAKAVLEGESYNRELGVSTHYHANYVAPYWSRKLRRTDRIGRHIFYRLRPGQT
jgi:hypothetical protein